MQREIFFLCFYYLSPGAIASKAENKLLKKLLKGYNILERPAYDENATVPLKINLGYDYDMIYNISKCCNKYPPKDNKNNIWKHAEIDRYLEFVTADFYM